MVVPAASSARAPAFRAQVPSGLPARSRAAGPRRGRAARVPFGGRPLRASPGRRLAVVRAAADAPRRDSGDSGDSAPPPPAGAYAGWWTRADAAAALAVAVERDGDDDALRLEDASRSLSPPAAPWLEMLELSATFGAAGGGLAAILLQETALVVLVAALPLVAYGARAKRDALARRFAAEAILEAREDAECARRKAAALGAATDVAAAAATRAVRAASTQTSTAIETAVERGVGAIKRDLVVLEGSVAESRRSAAAADARVADATDALSREVRSASVSALRAAKESGSVAGMLAKDVAASRVDAREAYEMLAGLLAEAAERAERRDGEARDEVALELGVVSETVENLEKSLAKVLASRDEDVASRGGGSDATNADTAVTAEERAASLRLSAESEALERSAAAESLEALSRAASAAKAAASAAERAAAAAENVTASSSSASGDDDRDASRVGANPVVVAKLDAEQWSLLGARLTQLETAAAAAAAEAAAEAGKAVGRVRAGVREDIRGASEALAAAAAATGSRGDPADLDEPSPSALEGGRRAPVSPERRRRRRKTNEEPSRPPRPFDDFASDSGLPFEFAERVAVPASEAAAASAFGRIAAEAALNEDRAGRSGTDGLPPVNAAVGLTKEAAFENMQALLRGKSNPGDVSSAGKRDAAATKEAKREEDVLPVREEEDASASDEDRSARPVRVSLTTLSDGRVAATLATRGDVSAAAIDSPTAAIDSPTATNRRCTTGIVSASNDDDSVREEPARCDDVSAEVSARARLDEGLASLRAARAAARAAGSNPSRMLEADAAAAAAAVALEAAAEAFADTEPVSGPEADEDLETRSAEEPKPVRTKSASDDARRAESRASLSLAGAAAARGNLGNALLARGRLQVRLSSMAASQERRAAESGVRAGAEGAAAFHAEIAEECLVLAGRAFRDALARCAASRDPRDVRDDSKHTPSAGAARALTGWGAALALRGGAALESALTRRRSASAFDDVASETEAFAVSASEAAALAAAASEKYRAALELDADARASDEENDANPTVPCFTAETRARAFLDWGDALRLAARASGEALAASSSPGFESGRGPGFFDAARMPPPGECWARAEACYDEALRWDREGCGEDALRGLRACEEAFRR